MKVNFVYSELMHLIISHDEVSIVQWLSWVSTSPSITLSQLVMDVCFRGRCALN